MKELLKKYYNFDIDDFNTFQDGIVFIYSGYKYYFCKSLFYEDDLKIIKHKTETLNIPFHTFVYNVDNRILSSDYVLMKLNVLEYDIDLNDVKQFSSVSGNISNFIDMRSFWYSKIDFLEKQVNELSSNKLINNSFDYFVGVSELILQFLGSYNENIKVCLSHKKMNSLSSIEFYNPLNISSDYYLKDIAYYIDLKKDYYYLDQVLDTINDNEKAYLFSRLCFPFRYFDELSKILMDKKSEKKLLDYLTNIKNYENKLLFLENKFNIFIFNWLNN